MTRSPSPLALRLLQRYVPDSEPLAGDLVEQFAARPSRIWLWSQVIAAVVSARLRRDAEIRPLRLVEQQPLDAIERTMAIQRRHRDVSPTPSPLPAGLGLIILGGLVTALAPIVWMGLLITGVAGVLLAWGLAARHQRHPASPPRRQLT